MRRVIGNVFVLVSLGFFTLDAAAQGSTTYYFPHLAVGASWQTTITYINYSPDEVTCQTDFISDYGSPLLVSFAALGTVVSRTDVLPPGGSVHQETNVDLSAPLAPGWARATCSGSVKASLLFRLHNSEGVPTAEAGVNAAAVPATRFVTFAEQGEGQFGTGVAYANPSATSAHVTFTAKDEAGQILASVARTLLPGGHNAHGMASLFGLTSFTGSLEVHSTVPIVSLSINTEAAPVFSSLPPGELDAATPAPAPPPEPSPTRSTNDMFSNAQTISGPSGRVTGSNVNATVESGEPGGGGRSVWWQWRAPSTGTVTIDTVGSSFDTILGVYTGTRVGALSTLAQNDDGVGLQSRVVLDVTAGTVYRLQVAGFSVSEGSIILNWNLQTATPPVPRPPPPPPPDPPVTSVPRPPNEEVPLPLPTPPSYPTPPEGKVVFWTDATRGYSRIDIKLTPGNFAPASPKNNPDGSLTRYLNGPPVNCDVSNAAMVVAELDPGVWSYRADRDGDTRWAGDITIRASQCLKVRLGCGPDRDCGPGRARPSECISEVDNVFYRNQHQAYAGLPVWNVEYNNVCNFGVYVYVSNSIYNDAGRRVDSGRVNRFYAPENQTSAGGWICSRNDVLRERSDCHANLFGDYSGALTLHWNTKVCIGRCDDYPPYP